MFFVSLPSKIQSGPNKDKPNLVEIKAAKLLDASGQAYVYKIPAELFSYPQFGPEPKSVTDSDGKVTVVAQTDDEAQEGIDEAIKDAGGKVKFLENYNSATKTAALNEGKGYIRTKESGDPSDIQQKGIEMSHDFTWVTAEKKTAKDIANEAEDLASMADDLDPAELKRRLKAMFSGKK